MNVQLLVTKFALGMSLAVGIFATCVADEIQTVDGDLTVTGDLEIRGNLIVHGDVVVRSIVQADSGTTPPVGPDSTFFTELWRLDQRQNGLSVTSRNEDGEWANPDADIRLDEQERVGSSDDDQAPKPILILHNPEKTTGPTYAAIRKLFDNYTLKDGQPEEVTEQELAEQEAFLDAIMPTAVMQRTLRYINDNRLTSQPMNAETMRRLLKKHWFELYTNHYRRDRPNPDVSGFEHVIVGDESRSGGIGGHHFWWKFLLDQLAGTADSVGHHYRFEASQNRYVTPPGEAYPLVATFGMRWKPQDRQLYSSKKGFFVGCSPEFMMAHGTLGLLLEQKFDTHQTIELDGGEFELVVHASTQEDRQLGERIRTVYPVLKNVESQVVSVAEARALPHGDVVAVRGVIVAEFNNQFGMMLRGFGDADETLAVQLKSHFRGEYSPRLKPEILNTKVIVYGTRGMYGMREGLREVFRIERVQD